MVLKNGVLDRRQHVTIELMLVYFTGSIVGKDRYIAGYTKILDILKSKGFETISDHIMKVTEQEIRMEKRDERLKFQKKLERWIGGCDFMIAETSFPSISVGYEISLALQRNKPVLVLHSVGDPPSLIGEHIDEKLICEKYTLPILNGIIDDFINYIKGTADTRFTFFITPEISVYLDTIAKKNKMPKSVYLRKLIEREMMKV